MNSYSKHHTNESIKLFFIIIAGFIGVSLLCLSIAYLMRTVRESQNNVTEETQNEITEETPEVVYETPVFKFNELNSIAGWDLTVVSAEKSGENLSIEVIIKNTSGTDQVLNPARQFGLNLVDSQFYTLSDTNLVTDGFERVITVDQEITGELDFIINEAILLSDLNLVFQPINKMCTAEEGCHEVELVEQVVE